MTVMRRLAWVAAIALSGSANAQVVRRTRAFDPVVECPFAAPRLDAASWEEVAWATEQLAEKPGDVAGTIVALRHALGRARASDSWRARRALPHLLFALHTLGAVMPASELDLPRTPGVRALLSQLLVRATDSDALLFREFSACPVDSPEWEVLGGALALRRQRAFAAELFAFSKPVLHVVVGMRGTRHPTDAMQVGEPAEPCEGFPPPPVCIWSRGRNQLLHMRDGRRFGLSQDDDPAPDTDSERARLRWLAYLARDGDAAAFSRRFELLLTPGDLRLAQQSVAVARESAQAGMRSLTAALVEQEMIPAAWAAREPQVRVQVHDCRTEKQRAAIPLPELK